MHRNHTLCSLGCPDIEDQEHIFTKCGQLKAISQSQPAVSYSYIYDDITKQKEAILVFMRIDKTRLHIKKHLLPGGTCMPGPCKFDVTTTNYAADIVLNCSNLYL